MKTHQVLPLLFATLLVACPSPPSEPKPLIEDANPAISPSWVDAGMVLENVTDAEESSDPAMVPRTPCAQACAALRRIGCPEGKPNSVRMTCTTVCEKAEAAKLTDFNTKCLAKATTKAEAIACGSVTCATR